MPTLDAIVSETNQIENSLDTNIKRANIIRRISNHVKRLYHTTADSIRVIGYTGLAAAVILAITAKKLDARTLYVSSEQSIKSSMDNVVNNEIRVPNNYTNIQDAIDAVVNGDIIIVADGTYKGDGNRDIDFKGKAITLRSENGPENCIIDCQGTLEDPHHGFYFHSGEGMDSLLDGFTIINGYSSRGGGVYCQNSSPTITNCIFSRNKNPGWKGGGILSGDSSPTIANCTFTGNFAEDGGGMHVLGSGNPIMINCLFVGNFAKEEGGGLATWYSATLINCTFANNRALWSGGIAGYAILTNCIVWDNWPNEISEYDMVTYSNVKGGCLGEGNIDTDPHFIAPGYWDDNSTPDYIRDDVWFDGDYHLQPDSPCIDTGDPKYLLDPDGTIADMGAVYFDQDRNMFIRGDTDINGEVNALDAIPIIYHLFENKQLECPDSADVDDNGKVDGNDVVYLVDYLYRSGPQPPIPFPEAGYDLTHDTLACYVGVGYGNANINDDCKVDFKDFAIFADTWLEKGLRLTGDIDGDKTVDFRDLKNIADNWLWYDYLRCD